MAMQEPTKLATNAQTWEIIASTVSYFVAGSLFIVWAMTLPLDIVLKSLLIIIGLLLLLCAPISAVLTFWISTTSIASKILKIGKPVILVATVLSAATAMVRMIQLFEGDSWQSNVYAWYALVFFLLLIAAWIGFIVRASRNRK